MSTSLIPSGSSQINVRAAALNSRAGGAAAAIVDEEEG
jgi:hypothetical protein